MAIIQARFGSTRLPGKVLNEISGKPMLWHMINRLRRCKNIDTIVLATSELKNNDVIEKFSKENDIPIFRGREEDVLSRYYYAARQFNADIIVRLTGDCPLIDPKIVDKIVLSHINSSVDYTSNVVKRTFPRGLDVEVINFQTLKKTFEAASEKDQREHVTLYLLENPDIFKLKSIEARGKIRRPDIRITVDTPEDLRFIRKIFSNLYKKNEIFYIEDVINLLNQKPELMEINKMIKQKPTKSL